MTPRAMDARLLGREESMPGTLHYGLWAMLPAVAMVAETMLVSPVHAATFVYVGNAESNDIYVLQLDRQSGDLTLVEHVPIPGITKPGISTPMAVSPDRRFSMSGRAASHRSRPDSLSTRRAGSSHMSRAARSP